MGIHLQASSARHREDPKIEDRVFVFIHGSIVGLCCPSIQPDGPRNWWCFPSSNMNSSLPAKHSGPRLKRSTRSGPTSGVVAGIFSCGSLAPGVPG